MSREGPVRVGEVVGEVLRRSGVDEQVRRQEALEAWPQAVGEGIARVSRARSLEGPTLFVEVRSSAWLMELNMMKAQILRRLNEGREDAPIDRIVFLIGSGGDPL